MATTVTPATATITITENIVLNGVSYGNSIDKSFEKAGIEGGVGWAENFDIYGWNDKGNYLNAVK